MKASKALKRFISAERYKKILFIFPAVMIACAVISLAQIITDYVVSGYIFNLGLFQRTQGIEFSDFFHTNDMVAFNSPYFGDTSSYPPFTFIIARIFALFGDYTYGYEVMISQPAAVVGLIIFYSIYFIASVLLIIYIMRSRGFGAAATVAVCAVYMLNAPMLFNFERGNYIICALLFSLVFYAFHSSENKVLRELSFIALGCATGIKLYPALFAVVLLREKRIFELLRCAAYSVLAIILPFLTFEGGLAGIPRFFYWLSDFSSDLTDYGYNYSVAGSVGIVFSFLGVPLFSENATVETLQKVVPYIALAICAVASVTVKKKWKALAAVSIAIIQFPNISFAYSLMFMLIPMLEFITDRQKDRRDYVYMALFAIILTPMYMGMLLPEYGITINQLATTAIMIIFELMLLAEGIIRIVCALRRYRIANAERVINNL